jgi:phosphoenolpyruvate-protein phosphotransferase/dihydroxyacetone kinase phosphotransfer subunit
MVGLVLVSHSRPLAEAVADLVRRAVNSDLRLTFSGGVGEGRVELGTDALEIQEAITSVYSDDGVLVLMDMGSAILSAETAKDLLIPEQQEKVRLTSAPLVEGGIAAAVQAQLGAPIEEVAKAALQSLLPKQDQVQDIVPDTEISQKTPEPAGNEILDLTIQNTHGLHLRPAATLIKTVSRFPGEVYIENRTANRGPVLVRSLVDLTRLQIRQGDSVRFSISTLDPKPVVDSIRSLVENHFGELPQPVQPGKTDGTPDASQPFGVSPGIAIGRPLLLETMVAPIPAYTVEAAPDITREISRLRLAITTAIEEFDNRINRLRPSLRADHLEVFDAQRMIFADPTILAEVQARIEKDHMNAASAWHAVLTRYATDQENAEDLYLRARAADFREVNRTVLNHLIGEKSILAEQPFAESTLLICEELTPTLAEELHRLSISGVIQLGGGATSHGAILARALGLPAIGGARNSLDRLRPAQLVAINGSAGLLWVDPPAEILSDLVNRQQLERSELQQARRESKEPAITKDGNPIEVGGNAGSANDVSSARQNGAEFIGLFRSEFLFQDFHTEPDEEQQLAAYREALAPTGGLVPITIRLLDIGGDKPLKFLAQAKETNPFLGVRGIRLLMVNPRFFRVHLRAILRLADSFRVQMLVPMITDLSEILATKKLLDEVAAELRNANLPHRWPIPLGAMIETPSAALLIDQLLPHLEFVSIGTNDLTQYVLCAERGSASLSSFSDSLHPAVLRLCEQVIRKAQAHRIKVSICGEIASDPEAIPVWLGLGLRELSVTAAAIPGVKSLIRKLELSAITAQLAARHLSFEGPLEVRTFSRSLTQ